MSEPRPEVPTAFLERERSAPLPAAAGFAVEAIGLNKIYSDGGKELRILRDLSLNIRRGEGVAILGPSGSGKTTLLNLLSGLDEPSSGQVFLDGVSIHELKPKARARFINKHIGFVFQFYHLLSELTALENVMLPVWIGGASHPVPAPRQRAAELLDRLGLKDRLAHFPSELSGGEQQRVAIARALVHDPKFLFCDEPTGNLDPEMGLEIAQVLKELFSERRKTVLIVTHDVRIAKMTNRIWNLVDRQWEKESV